MDYHKTMLLDRNRRAVGSIIGLSLVALTIGFAVDLGSSPDTHLIFYATAAVTLFIATLAFVGAGIERRKIKNGI
ncbi:MAG TPA: hypothetical protein VKW08_00365 [Xanthobacteraceae bacterium]|jgi:Ca2+/Na+ antiporter|nr:hypothetical protein [Xanthobacteraceae bacterium]